MRPVPPGYDETVDKYGIEILKVSGDLVIRNGDIAVSRARNLMLNDEVYSGLYRLVQGWRLSLPSLSMLFGLFEDAKLQQRGLERVLNELRPARGSPLFSAESVAKYHETNDQIDASQLALQSYAGAFLLIVNGLLQAFKNDIEVRQCDWERAGPLLGTSSIGAFIEAAANNFRHEDEWMKTKEPTKRQLASIEVLEGAFGKRFRDISEERFSPNVSPEVLDRLAAGDIENVGKTIFAFVNEVANRVREIAPT